MELVLELLVPCEVPPWLLCLVINVSYPFRLALDPRPSTGLDAIRPSIGLIPELPSAGEMIGDGPNVWLTLVSIGG
jgi:hypothetical protein